jgi:hypothetical protein
VTESKEIGITHSAVDSFVSSFSITHRNCFSAKPDGSLKALERVSKRTEIMLMDEVNKIKIKKTLNVKII